MARAVVDGRGADTESPPRDDGGDEDGVTDSAVPPPALASAAAALASAALLLLLLLWAADLAPVDLLPGGEDMVAGCVVYWRSGWFECRCVGQ